MSLIDSLRWLLYRYAKWLIMIIAVVTTVTLTISLATWFNHQELLGIIFASITGVGILMIVFLTTMTCCDREYELL